MSYYDDYQQESLNAKKYNACSELKTKIKCIKSSIKSELDNLPTLFSYVVSDYQTEPNKTIQDVLNTTAHEYIACKDEILNWVGEIDDLLQQIDSVKTQYYNAVMEEYNK